MGNEYDERLKNFAAFNDHLQANAMNVHNAMNSDHHKQLQAVMPQAQTPIVKPPLVDRIKKSFSRSKARGEILEYLEAQINLDPFKGNDYARYYYTIALQAAYEALENTK